MVSWFHCFLGPRQAEHSSEEMWWNWSQGDLKLGCRRGNALYGVTSLHKPPPLTGSATARWYFLLATLPLRFEPPAYEPLGKFRTKTMSTFMTFCSELEYMPRLCCWQSLFSPLLGSRKSQKGEKDGSGPLGGQCILSEGICGLICFVFSIFSPG